MTVRHKLFMRLFQDTNGQAHVPGLAYAEFDVDYRMNIDFSTFHAWQARIIVTAQGNDVGADKGIEIYDATTPAQLCEVEWTGNVLQNALAGSFSTANMPTAASQLQIRDKGAIAGEQITIYAVDLEIDYE